MTRNEQIYQDKKTMKVRDIQQKYGLSKRQVLAICREQSLRENLFELKKSVSYYRGKYFNSIVKR